MEIATTIIAMVSTSVLSGLGGAVITALAIKKSDERKSNHEDKTNQERRVHEKEMQREERAYTACVEMYTQSTELLARAIDTDSPFDQLRDLFDTLQGLPEKRFEPKISFTKDRVDDFKSITILLNRVRFDAPPPVRAEAVKLYQCLREVFDNTTDPLGVAAAVEIAGRQLDWFLISYRDHYEYDRVTYEDDHETAVAFAGEFEKAVKQLAEDARVYFREAGFARTPWD